MSRQTCFAVAFVSFLLSALMAHSLEAAAQKRGFRNSALSTARGFGKRGSGSEIPAAAAQLLEDMEPGETQFAKAVPVAWFAEQVNRNPALAKVLVDRALDSNGDGYISADELY